MEIKVQKIKWKIWDKVKLRKKLHWRYTRDRQGSRTMRRGVTVQLKKSMERPGERSECAK